MITWYVPKVKELFWVRIEHIPATYSNFLSLEARVEMVILQLC